MTVWTEWRPKIQFYSIVFMTLVRYYYIKNMRTEVVFRFVIKMIIAK